MHSDSENDAHINMYKDDVATILLNSDAISIFHYGVAVYNGNEIRAYEDDNTDYWYFRRENDNDGAIGAGTIGGSFNIRSTGLNVRNVPDSGYVNVQANAFIELSIEVKDSNLEDILIMNFYGEDWKSSFPEEMKSVDKEGRVGLNVGMEARLALKGVKELYEKIKKIEEIIGR